MPVDIDELAKEIVNDLWYRNQHGPGDHTVAVLRVGDILRARLRASEAANERLREAAKAFLSTACRPGDDGRFDDSYDDKRRALTTLLAPPPETTDAK